MFPNKLESIQYNAAISITRPMKGTSKTKLYTELSLEYLKVTVQKIVLFLKI